MHLLAIARVSHENNLDCATTDVAFAAERKKDGPLKLIGVAGSYSRPSKTRSLVEQVSALASERHGFRRRIYDLHDAGPSLGQAQRCEDLDPNARQLIDDIIAADASAYRGRLPPSGLPE